MIEFSLRNVGQKLRAGYSPPGYLHLTETLQIGHLGVMCPAARYSTATYKHKK